MDKIHHIPTSEVVKYLTIFSNLPIVSVGCGTGTIEYALKQECIDNLILVDPYPESYEKYPENSEYLEPDYATVEDLLIAKPDLYGECVLFLSWPSPNNSHYDAEAIRLLNPKAVILIYETKGAAGGYSLHRWLGKIGAKYNKDYKTEKVRSKPSSDYHVLRSYIKRRRGIYDMLIFNMILIVKNGTTIPDKIINKIKDVSLYPKNYDKHIDGTDDDKYTYYLKEIKIN